MRGLFELPIAGAVLLAGCQPPQASNSVIARQEHRDAKKSKMPIIITGYGSGGFPITTKTPQAQAFFDNGMQLGHAFAHQAAIQAMTQSVRLDRDCAMCLWGVAWAAGPTINYGRSDEQLAALAKITERASALAAKNGTPRERAMIDALRWRYESGNSNVAALKFAKAIEVISAREPGNGELAVLAADAWLQIAPKWSPEGKGNARVAIGLLEPILKKHPNYSPAIHFYIHATEMAGVPGRAELYADRLASLAPRASHLVHMSSHTYYWVGRYQDAVDANIRAVKLDADNARVLGKPPPDGVWGLPYHMHNVSYGLGSALESGDSKIALYFGRALIARAQMATKSPPSGHLTEISGYFAFALFASPAEVLGLRKPNLPFYEISWHYARGEAFARVGRLDGVRAEIAAIRSFKGPEPKDEDSLRRRDLTLIALEVLTGRAAMIERRFGDAAVAFRRAAEVEESDEFSASSDPPAWYYPVRRDLAAALLASGNPEKARKEALGALVYRKKDPGTLSLLASIHSKEPAR